MRSVGNQMHTVAGAPTVTVAVPPWASAMACTMARPIPDPGAAVGRVRPGQPFEGTRGEPRREPVALVADLDRHPAVDPSVADNVIVPRPWRRALSTRLVITCRSRSWSALTKRPAVR